MCVFCYKSNKKSVIGGLVIKILDFFLKAGKLKQIKRKGWLRQGIPQPESVADHCFRTTLIALIIGTKLNLNLERLLQLAIIHDLAESIVGDITPYDQEYDQKIQKEVHAIKSLETQVNIGLLELWRDYEEGKSKEAEICRQIDKFEMILQAYEYENEVNANFEEFWQSEKEITHPILRKMIDELKVKRKK
ncbi:MAG: HD domain-containing protein [Promethearchaeota archaeon]